MNHQDGARPISSGTGSATSQPITSSRLRPTPLGESPAREVRERLRGTEGDDEGEDRERRAQPEVLLADEREHAALEPDHRPTSAFRPTRRLNWRRSRADRADPSVTRARLPCRSDWRRRSRSCSTGEAARRRRARRRTRPGPWSASIGLWARSKPIERDRVAGEAAAADRAAVVARIDDDVIGQLEQPAELRVQEPRLSERVARDVQVGPPDVADQERVAAEHEPRLVGAAAPVGDRRTRDAQARDRRRDRRHDRVAELDHVAVRRARRARTSTPALRRQIRGRAGALDERRQTRTTWSACTCVSKTATIGEPIADAAAR